MERVQLSFPKGGIILMVDSFYVVFTFWSSVQTLILIVSSRELRGNVISVFQIVKQSFHTYTNQPAVAQ